MHTIKTQKSSKFIISALGSETMTSDGGHVIMIPNNTQFDATMPLSLYFETFFMFV